MDMPSIAADEKKSHVTFDGRTIVDTNALVRSDKVRETLDKIASAVKASDLSRRKGVVVLRRRRPSDSASS